MATYNCDKCQKPTSTIKEITAKATGKKHILWICQSGCMNGKYQYGFFPPKEVKAPSQSAETLNEILKVLQDIRSILSVQKGITVAQVGEMGETTTNGPDDDFSFPQ